MLRAVIYARFSSDQQDSATIATQIAECSAKAQALGAIVVKTFADEAQSGTGDDREQFRAMLQEARQKPRPWDVVIVRKFDRFARNALDARLTEDILEKCGVKLVSAMEGFDDSTPGGWMSKQMLHLINEWYSRNLASETKSGMVTNTKKGFRCGGAAPYGYQNAKKVDQATGKTRTVLEVHPQEFEAVRLIFRRYAEGAGQPTIIRELTERGFLPRKAKTWNKSQISQMICNETYIGVLIWRRTPDPATWIRTPGGAPRIIDEKTWEKVQTRANASRKPEDRAVARVQHPLAGIVFCGKCGSRFVLGQKNDGRFRMVCSSKKYRSCENKRTVDETTLVEKIITVLVDKIFTREAIASALEELRQDISPNIEKLRKDLAGTKSRLSVVTSRETAMVEELFKGELPREAVKNALEKTELEKAGIIVRIRDIEAEIEAAQAIRIGDQDIEDFLAMTRQTLRTAKGPELNSAFRRFGVRVEIDGDGGQISVNPAISGGVRAVTTSAGSGT